ncbi:hypothetical protein ROG8370_02742 [Roseovarius gaetbuli]|uniref:Transporter n=1 Tax=Roseovarius gaetbuli TaxID=1356575 RepID=A0A1X6ZS58_9RHOB|nr:hypothetical protein [Roseovarius gaetbuli]SLN59496.1 hypothetical protein ROG8370_02742 [Roseovarius gaetbuli]
MHYSMATLAAIIVLAAPVSAQDVNVGTLAQRRVDNQEVNNGTNPTLLTTSAGIQYTYNDIRGGFSSGMWEAFVGVPFGSRKQFQFQVTVPYADSALNDDFGLGDVSLKFVHVVDVNASRGIAYTAEVFLDTADRPDLGNGQEVLEFSAFYAKFLPGGNIFAPAWVQTVGLDGKGSNGQDINRTTIDFYYVPKLANPKFFMAFDPALSYDWKTDKAFASLQTTFGMLTGKFAGGDSQIFIKPGIYAGGDRPLDFSVQVGFKILGF